MYNRNVFLVIFTFFSFLNVNHMFSLERGEATKSEMNKLKKYSQPVSAGASFAAAIGSIGFFFNQKSPRNKFLAVFVAGSTVQQSLNIMNNFCEIRNRSRKN